MAKVLCLDDYQAYSDMVAGMLEKHGHQVKSEIVPVAFDEILAYDPDVLVLAIVRKLETISSGGMHDFYRDVEGAQALRQVLQIPELRAIPLVITSLAVLESELPPEITGYLAFLEVPQKLDALNAAVTKVAAAYRRGQEVARG